jgi:hypothetical protein
VTSGAAPFRVMAYGDLSWRWCGDPSPSLHADAWRQVLARGAPQCRFVAHTGNDSLSFPAAGHCEGSLNCPHAPNIKKDLVADGDASADCPRQAAARKVSTSTTLVHGQMMMTC